jgi:predicted flap endonuclease-1-like 5' DNA nuclease
MDFENMNIWCWLIPLLVGAICGILGYLLGKSGRATLDNTIEHKLLQDKNTKLQADLDACNKKASSVSSANMGTSAASFAAGAAVTSVPFDGAIAKAAMGKTIKQDDLKVVEGIGPKIDGMFKDAGIKTWKALSEVHVADCKKILDKGGKRYQIHDPASWPMQAKMCYEGKWKELAKWQNEHKHGKL